MAQTTKQAKPRDATQAEMAQAFAVVVRLLEMHGIDVVKAGGAPAAVQALLVERAQHQGVVQGLQLAIEQLRPKAGP